jgi:hypothetical protein
MFAVLQRLKDSLKIDVSYDVELEPRLSESSRGDKRYQETLIRNIAESFAAALASAEALDTSKPLLTEGVGAIRFFQDRPGSLRGIGGVQLSDPGKARKILENGVMKAAAQLIKHDRGVAVQVDFAPPFNLLDMTLRALREAHPQLFQPVAFVVVARMSRPVVWRNDGFPECPTTRTLAADIETVFKAGIPRLNIRHQQLRRRE